MKWFYLLVALVQLSCASKPQLQKNPPLPVFEKQFESFFQSYSKSPTDFKKSVADDFIYKTIYPVSDHVVVQYGIEFESNNLNPIFLGQKIKVLNKVLFHPWVGMKVQMTDGSQVFEDFVVLKFKKGVLVEWIHALSFKHYNHLFKTQHKGPTHKAQAQLNEKISKVYEKQDMKLAREVSHERWTFLKMNPGGDRDLSMTRKWWMSFVSKNPDDKMSIKNEFIELLSPWSLIFLKAYKETEYKTGRLILRRMEGKKFGFTINFVGTEEFNRKSGKDFYIEKPIFNYQRRN